MAQIKIGTDIAYTSGRGGTKWPVEKFIAAIDGVWLKSKDGRLRKFQTRYAARLAAQEEAAKAKA